MLTQLVQVGVVGANHIPGIVADWGQAGSANSARLHSDYMQTTPSELLHTDTQDPPWQAKPLSIAAEGVVVGGLVLGVYSFQKFWGRKWPAGVGGLETGSA